MTNRKNQNSLLVLATLGVYLGLVLAGATPQVLAQAAMTKQFNVKDEVEIKDNLDKKPGNLLNDIAESTVSEIDHKITRSIGQFLAKFKSVDSVSSLSTSADATVKVFGLRPNACTISYAHDLNLQAPLRQILTLSNYPRAGLDPLLASDAK